jgi:hypothetical protein
MGVGMIVKVRGALLFIFTYILRVLPKQTKFFKNAFKRTKRDEKSRKSGRVLMAIGVPNCERKTPIFDLLVRLNAFSVEKRV